MKKIGFIGMGNMASAILSGVVSSGMLKGEDVIVYDIVASQMNQVSDLGVTLASNEKDVVKQSEIIFIAVKPQVLEGVIKEIKDDLKNKALLSIALGYDYETYSHLLDESTRHIFVMPNTPVQVNEGMCLIEEKHSLTEEEFSFVKDMFKSIGEIEVVPSHYMGPAGALSGCGPAFIYMIIEGLADGAVKEGIPRNLAYKLASQTVLGSAKMQKDLNIHPGELKDKVCSPGGSTIRGVEALEKGRIRSLMMEAISRATHYKS